jgi:DNA-binding NarL/FixJ family response regulator
MFAEAMEFVLAGEPGLEVMGVVTTGEAAIEQVRRDRPDVVLMDLDLPGIDGMEATRQIRQIADDTRVVIVSSSQPPAMMAQAIEVGACCFVSKRQTANHLAEAIRQAAAGEMVMPDQDLPEVLSLLQETRRTRSATRGILGLLTEREIEILQGFAAGHSTSDLAEMFSIATSTVQSHVRNILAKLEVHSRLEAITLAIREGVVVIGDGGSAWGRPTGPRISARYGGSLD